MKYPFLTVLLFVLACGERRTTVADRTPAKDSAAAPKHYFPVMGFLKGEIANVDSLPVGIKRYLGSNHTKFEYIKPAEFHRLAAEFIPSELSDGSFQQNFTETSFLDRSTNSATFFYAAKNESVPVRRVDVLTAKGDVYDQVKSIYLQKNYRSGDTSITKKLFWKPQRNFQIITEMSIGAAQPTSTIVNVVWDNREE